MSDAEVIVREWWVRACRMLVILGAGTRYCLGQTARKIAPPHLIFPPTVSPNQDQSRQNRPA